MNFCVDASIRTRQNIRLSNYLIESSRGFKKFSEKSIQLVNVFIQAFKSGATLENYPVLFLAVFGIVFISRLPFILPGYGIDPDAWGVAIAARQISLTGSYTLSRFPGYPFQEYVYSLFRQGGPLIMNGLTALLSGCAAAFLSLVVKKLGGQFPLLTGLVFAFIPVVYINSVNSMDYVWAICFILGSLYFLLVDRMTLSGVFLGLAIGTRITSGAMLLPLGILWLMRGGKKIELFKFAGTAVIIGGISFLPVFLKYGAGFFKYTEAQRPPLNAIIRSATVYVWGLVGIATLGILLLLVMLVIFSRYQPPKKPPYTIIWILTIGLYLVAFLRLPDDPGYLIPTLPFLLILLNSLLMRKIFIFFSIGILLSPFLFGFEYKNILPNDALEVNFYRWHIYVYPLAGPIIQDNINRNQELELYREIFRFGNELENKSIFIVGWNIPKFVVLGETENFNRENVVFTTFPTQDEVQSFIRDGNHIYYLPELSATSRELYGVDLEKMGAVPINRSTILNEP